ncbi:hypothetical protein J2Z44_004291 [Clostridium punense]|uniref:Novel toxin 17 domain-containing protein n=1 Tax=Clostridium punense TaxID=1054297 RepID=A0ABS4K9J4_9CLOT|nr:MULTISPECIES: polymorphic toxin type 17 domain-containing protein [Clostridium]EQB89250.1 hypothetical protein M918_21260 [Clostridium sp. BL8]MBP2024422.1 hypothetical protein [Clostridium punense]
MSDEEGTWPTWNQFKTWIAEKIESALFSISPIFNYIEALTGKTIITGKSLKDEERMAKADQFEDMVVSGTFVGSVKNISVGKKTIIKSKGLPTKGKIRYVPPKNWTTSQPLPRSGAGFTDRFGNVWTKGPSRTAGQAFEWDVQLSKSGKSQLGHFSRDGSHLNISLDGKITHK